MKDIEANSQKGPDRQAAAGAAQTTPISHFKRDLVPLDEYAAREGISSDIVEQQGQLGAIQIRKYKGQKYVVDVDPEQLSRFEAPQDEEIAPGAQASKQRPTTVSKLVTAGLTAGLIIIIVGVFWFYLDAKTRLDDLTAEHAALQTSYNNLTSSTGELKETQDELAASKVRLSQIQSRIAQSKIELEKIQADLNKSRQNLDTIQSELTTIQGQVALSKVELESIRNVLNDSKNDLDTLANQNAQAVEQ
jgi:DNA repair exonuclease SbcCD ATPase subunit